MSFGRFCDFQDLLGVLEGPRRALGGLRFSPGRFWDLLGRPGRVPGRRPIDTFRGKIGYTYRVLELGRFSVTGSGVWILFVFVYCFSVCVFIDFR